MTSKNPSSEFMDEWIKLLRYLIREGHTQALGYLIRNDSDIDMSQEDLKGLLFHAITVGSLDSVKIIVETEFDIEPLKESAAVDLLMCAIVHEDSEIAEFLLDAGIVSFKSLSESKAAGLLTSAVFNALPGTVKYLLDAGIDPNAKTERGNTALMSVSSRKGHSEAVEITKLLIDRGADVNARDSHETTVLMKSSVSNSKEVVKLLLEAGANPEVANDDYDTAYIWASKRSDNRSNEILSALRSHSDSEGKV